MAAETKGRTSKSQGHTRGWVKQQRHHAETRDLPSQDPEITWRKPSRHNNSHIVTSKHSRCDAALPLFASKCHVISGILAGGIPGFRMVRLLLRSPSGMAWWCFCSPFCFCCHTMLRWYNVITSCSNQHMNWHLSRLGSALFSVAVFGFVSGVLFVFLVFALFCFFVWLRDDLLDCTQVLYQFTLEATQSVDGHICTN